MDSVLKYRKYIFGGAINGGFLCYRFGGLIFGGAYTWRGLFSEFYGNWILTGSACLAIA